MSFSKIHKIPSLNCINIPVDKVEILVENPENAEEWGFFIDLESMSHLSRFINHFRKPSSNPIRRPVYVIHEEPEEWIDDDEQWIKKNINYRFQMYIWAISHLNELVFATFIASSVAIYTIFIG